MSEPYINILHISVHQSPNIWQITNTNSFIIISDNLWTIKDLIRYVCDKKSQPFGLAEHERSYSTSHGVLKPDILALRDAVFVDAQIGSRLGCDISHSNIKIWHQVTLYEAAEKVHGGLWFWVESTTLLARDLIKKLGPGIVLARPNSRNPKVYYHQSALGFHVTTARSRTWLRPG